MKTELYKAIKSIDVKSLSNDDIEDLLQFFMTTKNALIRNQIAFIFSDLHYDKAIPYILKKINDKDISHNNGSLVYSLTGFDMKKYFVDLVKIICVHEYEPRLMAYEIVLDIASSIPNKTKNKALEILEKQRANLDSTATDRGENSMLHFVEQTKKVLYSSIKAKLE
jgi:hypothetical protein